VGFSLAVGLYPRHPALHGLLTIAATGDFVMSASAQIIPFPVHPTAVPPPPEGSERLARALALLDAALVEQRAAVTTWRDGLTALHTSVAGLDGSLRTYQAQLAALQGRTEGVRDAARRLETWADTALRPVT
jgi:hypothetical protein